MKEDIVVSLFLIIPVLVVLYLHFSGEDKTPEGKIIEEAAESIIEETVKSIEE